MGKLKTNIPKLQSALKKIGNGRNRKGKDSAVKAPSEKNGGIRAAWSAGVAKLAKPQKAARPEKEAATARTTGKKWMIFSIRNKIMVCFLIPVLFMIAIGLTSYQRAAEGMSAKYSESTSQTIDTAVEYVDVICNFIESEGLKYAYDTDLSKYFAGLYEDDALGKMNLMTSVKANITASQTSNDFISNIHIVTKSGVLMMSTAATTNNDGIFAEYSETVATGKRGIERWIDSHDMLDEQFSMKKEKYIMAYETLSGSGNACVVIDIKADAIEEFIQGIDLGEGSIVGLVTKNGRELVCRNLGETAEANADNAAAAAESVFFQQGFFPAADSEELQGSMEVDYNGKSYMFFYGRSEASGCTICALVPTELIIGQAEAIKSITVALVIVACIVVVAVGILIVIGIQKNMKRIEGTLEEVAGGDLTVSARAKGHDEFKNLAGSANDMIVNTKKLVNKVNAATVQLEASAKDVAQVSDVINSHSEEITQEINGISETMTQQTANVQECVAKTDILSEEMQEVSRVVERVEKLVSETEDIIGQGMGIVRLLGEKAQQTTEITEKVGNSIDSLRRESETINSFVGTITDISEQTNLLSLNASIEAARAGDAGRGFAVVAEEIRKLADDSAVAAGEIRNNVEVISTQTMNSVQSAKEAQAMVFSQTEAVEQAVSVFNEIEERMKKLVDGLNAIVISTEKADAERVDTVTAIRQISNSIEETANSAMNVRDAVEKLMENVEGLNRTAESLGENMDGLKSEISVFKV